MAVNDVNDCLNVPIIAELDYFHNFTPRYPGDKNLKCLAYPRWIKKSGKYERIDPNIFHSKAINVWLVKDMDDDAEQVFKKYGSFIIVQISKWREPTQDQQTPISNTTFNPDYGEKSYCRIEKVHGRFWQVLDADMTFNELKGSRKIPASIKIHTETILVKTKDGLFGPFGWSRSDNNYELSGVPANDYFIVKFANPESLLIDVGLENETKVTFVDTAIISSFKGIPEESLIDWMDDDTLVDSLADYFKNREKQTGLETPDIKNAFDVLVGNENEFRELLTEKRIKRAIDILKKASESGDYTILRKITYAAWEDTTCRESIIDNILTERTNELLEKINDTQEYRKLQEEEKDKIAELQQEREGLEQKIDELQQEKDSLKGRISESQKEALLNQEDEKLQKLDKLDSEIREKKQELDAIEQRLELAKELEVLKGEIEDARKLRDATSDEIRTKKDEAEKIEKEMRRAIQRTTQQVKEKVTSSLIDKTFLDIFLQDVQNKDVDVPSSRIFNKELLHKSEKTDKKEQADEIITRVSVFLRNAGRGVSKNEVVNYLTCITQGFITTFAGEPGTGKTSLCNLLADALGLSRRNDENDSRFVEISVERGWTSHKDFAGYYNPLSKQMEKSNPEVFNALEQLRNEVACPPDEIAPFFMLLDEANLSPIEHYWAAFLRNCDFDSSGNRSINMGGKDNHRIPDHLRFLATVNFDHTTEELSPRFLDRSWIITLKPESFRSTSTPSDMKDIISYASLKELFEPEKDEEIKEHLIREKWENIIKIFKDAELPIFPRSRKMVTCYCITACKYMERDSADTRFAPLDYAIAQKILPAISGMGEQYKKLFDELRKVCQDLSLTFAHLQRIKDAAEQNMGFYQFFSK